MFIELELKQIIFPKRNIFPGTVYNKGGNEQTNLYGTFVEVDYRDYEVFFFFFFVLR